MFGPVYSASGFGLRSCFLQRLLSECARSQGDLSILQRQGVARDEGRRAHNGGRSHLSGTGLRVGKAQASGCCKGWRQICTQRQQTREHCGGAPAPAARKRAACSGRGRDCSRRQGPAIRQGRPRDGAAANVARHQQARRRRQDFSRENEACRVGGIVRGRSGVSSLLLCQVLARRRGPRCAGLLCAGKGLRRCACRQAHARRRGCVRRSPVPSTRHGASCSPQHFCCPDALPGSSTSRHSRSSNRSRIRSRSSNRSRSSRSSSSRTSGGSNQFSTLRCPCGIHTADGPARLQRHLRPNHLFGQRGSGQLGRHSCRTEHAAAVSAGCGFSSTATNAAALFLLLFLFLFLFLFVVRHFCGPCLSTVLFCSPSSLCPCSCLCRCPWSCHWGWGLGQGRQWAASDGLVHSPDGRGL